MGEKEREERRRMQPSKSMGDEREKRSIWVMVAAK